MSSSPPNIRVNLRIFDDAITSPIKTGNRSLIFAGNTARGDSIQFGAVIELIGLSSIEAGMSGEAMLHCWRPEANDAYIIGNELIIWWGKYIGIADIIE